MRRICHSPCPMDVKTWFLWIRHGALEFRICPNLPEFARICPNLPRICLRICQTYLAISICAPCYYCQPQLASEDLRGIRSKFPVGSGGFRVVPGGIRVKLQKNMAMRIIEPLPEAGCTGFRQPRLSHATEMLFCVLVLSRTSSRSELHKNSSASDIACS